MVCIVDRLSKTLNRKITSEQIWTHLKTMYNLKTLDEQEPLPFPNNLEEFKMPEIFDPKSEYNRFRLELEQINPRRSESEDGDGSSKGGNYNQLLLFNESKLICNLIFSTINFFYFNNHHNNTETGEQQKFTVQRI